MIHKTFSWICCLVRQIKLLLSKIIKSQNKMKNLVETLTQQFEEFAKDAVLQVENGNKAAGTRARKASLAIEKALKEFRKVSIEASK